MRLRRERVLLIGVEEFLDDGCGHQLRVIDQELQKSLDIFHVLDLRLVPMLLLFVPR